jgi:integrase
VGDIDLTARRLYVRRAAPEVEGRIVIGPTKNQAGTRTIPLPQVVVDALKPRVAGNAADRPAVTSPNGKLLRSNNWRRHTHWNKVLKKTHLAPLTIHDLRHTYASLSQVRGIAFDASFGVVGDRDAVRDFGFGAAADPAWWCGRHAV